MSDCEPEMDILCERHILRGVLETKTRLEVRGGVPTPGADAGVARLRTGAELMEGTLFIPGSTVKGVARREVFGWLAGLAGRESDSRLPLCVPRCGAVMPPEGKPVLDCIVCRLFGSVRRPSRVLFRDVIARDGRALTGHGREMRMQSRGMVQPGATFTREYVPPGMQFALEIVLENPKGWEAGLVLAGLGSAAESASLGSAGSRGRGQFEIHWKEVLILTPESFLSLDGKPRHVFPFEEYRRNSASQMKERFFPHAGR